MDLPTTRRRPTDCWFGDDEAIGSPLKHTESAAAPPARTPGCCEVIAEQTMTLPSRSAGGYVGHQTVQGKSAGQVLVPGLAITRSRVPPRSPITRSRVTLRRPIKHLHLSHAEVTSWARLSKPRRKHAPSVTRSAHIASESIA
jgi:hypothetical protein